MPPTPADFPTLIAPHREALHRYCYRLLASLADADDALQETLLDAWRGLDGFEGHGSLRAWLFTIATRACIRIADRRAKRISAPEPSSAPPTAEIDITSGDLTHPWLDPYPTGPSSPSPWPSSSPSSPTSPASPSPSHLYDSLESIELAYISALQTLAPRQRAALILCDVVGLTAEETAAALDTTVAATTSALQRARATLSSSPRSQQSILRDLGSPREADLVRRFVHAWERSDVDALVSLLADDARFTMPPLRTWLSGRASVEAFLRPCMSASARKLEPTRANGQLAFVVREAPDWNVGALNVVTLTPDGSHIAEMTAFLDPAVQARFLRPPDRGEADRPRPRRRIVGTGPTLTILS